MFFLILLLLISFTLDIFDGSEQIMNLIGGCCRRSLKEEKTKFGEFLEKRIVGMTTFHVFLNDSNSKSLSFSWKTNNGSGDRWSFASSSDENEEKIFDERVVEGNRRLKFEVILIDDRLHDLE